MDFGNLKGFNVRELEAYKNDYTTSTTLKLNFYAATLHVINFTGYKLIMSAISVWEITCIFYIFLESFIEVEELLDGQKWLESREKSFKSFYSRNV